MTSSEISQLVLLIPVCGRTMLGQDGLAVIVPTTKLSLSRDAVFSFSRTAGL